MDEQPYDAPFVAEFFIGSEAEPLTVYATLGMSDLPMPDAPNDLRLELFMYANEPLDGCASVAELPDAARGYVEFVERELGVEVTLVGTGAERSSVLTRA